MRFTTRDVLWLTVVVALACGNVVALRRVAHLRSRLEESEMLYDQRKTEAHYFRTKLQEAGLDATTPFAVECSPTSQGGN